MSRNHIPSQAERANLLRQARLAGYHADRWMPLMREGRLLYPTLRDARLAIQGAYQQGEDERKSGTLCICERCIETRSMPFTIVPVEPGHYVQVSR